MLRKGQRMLQYWDVEGALCRQHFAYRFSCPLEQHHVRRTALCGDERRDRAALGVASHNEGCTRRFVRAQLGL